MLITTVNVLAYGPTVAQAASANEDILNQFRNIITVSSTVPSNGDIDPYGAAQVTSTIGKLYRANILKNGGKRKY